VKTRVRILDVSFFSSPIFIIENNLSYLIGGNITSVAISATLLPLPVGGNITSVALSDTCFSKIGLLKP